MNEKLNEALEQISDKHIQEAAHRKRNWKPFFGVVAAVLALVMGVKVVLPALTKSKAERILSEALVSAPTYPERAQNESGRFSGFYLELLNQLDAPEGYADSLTPFFKESIQTFLAADNSACSPLNVYMALAMLAETSDGNTRQQILDLLGLDSIEELRSQVYYVWNYHYQDDGVTSLLLANSVWLDDGYHFSEDTANILAEKYYAYSYSGDLGTKDMNLALQHWLNTQTDGLLEDQTRNVKLSPETVFALASTVYYKVRWEYRFSKENNTKDPFHTPSGDVTATYMHKTIKDTTYYYDDHYGAVALSLNDNGYLWIVLPDEGYTPRQLLKEGDCLSMILEGTGQSREAEIILSLPKFDIASDMDLSKSLQTMGITDAFTPGTANFSPLTKDTNNLAIGEVTHGTRVAIDEEGITAAAFTGLYGTGGIPPDLKQIEFNVNRPFLFVITSFEGLPLFAGMVQEP